MPDIRIVYVKKLSLHDPWVQFSSCRAYAQTPRTISVMYKDEFADIFGRATLQMLTEQWQKFTISCTPLEEAPDDQ